MFTSIKSTPMHWLKPTISPGGSNSWNSRRLIGPMSRARVVLFGGACIGDESIGEGSNNGIKCIWLACHELPSLNGWFLHISTVSFAHISTASLCISSVAIIMRTSVYLKFEGLD